MNILESIVQERLAAVKADRQAVSLESLQAAAADRVHHSLKQRLQDVPGSAIISEMKKASPSAGLLQTSYDPTAIAKGYLANGAAAISILTEPLHFLGSGDDLRAVRPVVDLPLLRKDFMCDPYQVAEAAAWGADVVLLIAAALTDTQLHMLYETACSYGLEVLAEVHTREELERVLPLSDAVLGVNSRNLKTLKTDLQVAHDLAPYIPDTRVSIAESGISLRSEILELEAVGYDGFLIGEALVRHNDPGGRLRELLGL